MSHAAFWSGLLSAFVLLMPPVAAGAQSSGLSEGFFLEGYGELGLADTTDRADAYYRTDIDLGFRPADGTGLGLELGFDSFGEQGLHANALYPSLSYNSFIGRFSIGNPRSVVERGYGPTMVFSNSTQVDTLFRLAFGSAVNSGLWQGGDSYGIRYDGALGDALIGASAHRINTAGSDMSSYALAFHTPVFQNRSSTSIAVFGSVERVESGGKGRTGYSLGAEAQMEKLHGALRYRKSPLAASTELLEGLLDYALNERFKLSLGLAHERSTDATNFYGVGAQYDFLENGYIKGSVVDNSTSGSDPRLDVAVGFRF